jgi:hypothetical protein
MPGTPSQIEGISFHPLIGRSRRADEPAPRRPRRNGKTANLRKPQGINKMLIYGSSVRICATHLPLLLLHGADLISVDCFSGEFVISGAHMAAAQGSRGAAGGQQHPAA